MKHTGTKYPDRGTKVLLEKASSSKARIYLGLDKAEVRALAGINTGHCQLNKHLTNIEIPDNRIRRGCLEEEDTHLHLLYHCKAFISNHHKIYWAIEMAIQGN